MGLAVNRYCTPVASHTCAPVIVFNKKLIIVTAGAVSNTIPHMRNSLEILLPVQVNFFPYTLLKHSIDQK